MNINAAIEQAEKAGFEHYGEFNEGEQQHIILLCMNGEYSGEVIDLYYVWLGNGECSRIEYSAQFKGQIAKFRLID